MSQPQSEPLIRRVDAIEFSVPSIEAGLAFYRDRLGHELVWRSATAAGLRMPETNAEIVIQTERKAEPALLVASADGAAVRMIEAGGTVIVPPHDVPVGRVVVAEDPWGNRLVLLDLSKGTFVTDADGNVTGVDHETRDE